MDILNSYIANYYAVLMTQLADSVRLSEHPASLAYMIKIAYLAALKSKSDIDRVSMMQYEVHDNL